VTFKLVNVLQKLQKVQEAGVPEQELAVMC
jgi:hypothetical protein